MTDNIEVAEGMSEAERSAVDAIRAGLNALILARYNCATAAEFAELVQAESFAKGLAKITLGIVWPDCDLRLTLHESNAPPRELLHIELPREVLPPRGRMS